MADDLAAENVRLRFALQSNVPLRMTERLRGDTVEELATDWASLSVHIPAKPDPSAPRVPKPVAHQGAQPCRLESSDVHLYQQIYGARK